MEILLGIIAIVSLGGYIYFSQKVISDYRKDNRDLLDRLMAKNFGEYAVVEQNKMLINKEPKTIIKEQDEFPVV